MSDAEWDQVISVHLKGAFACTKAAWPHLRNQKFGRIVNISSAAGIYGVYMDRILRFAHVCHPPRSFFPFLN